MICYSLAQIVTRMQGKNKFTGRLAVVVSRRLSVVVGVHLNQDWQDF